MEEKKFTNKKEEATKVMKMPEKVNGVYENVEFDKDQLKQLLVESGMEARSAAGQATVLWKQANPWNTSMLIKHYSNSKSKIKESLMTLLGADEEAIQRMSQKM